MLKYGFELFLDKLHRDGQRRFRPEVKSNIMMDGVVYSDGFRSADFLENFPEGFNRFGTAVL